jgi:hypothetical protein
MAVPIYLNKVSLLQVAGVKGPLPKGCWGLEGKLGVKPQLHQHSSEAQLTRRQHTLAGTLPLLLTVHAYRTPQV